MGWGVLEDPRTECPPGTAKIGDTEAVGRLSEFPLGFYYNI